MNERSDLIVMVGGNVYDITSDSQQQLTCRLPTNVINSNEEVEMEFTQISEMENFSSLFYNLN